LPDIQNAPLISDIGGSNGVITKLMSDKGYEMLLIEPSEQACANASKRGVQNIICATISDNGFKQNSLDYCLLLDVIEHIEDDLGFLKVLYDKMSAGAKLIVTVPAFMHLWSSHDENLRHFRRYLLKDLENKLKEAGFSILNSSYYFSFLYLPIFMVCLFEKIGILKKFSQRSNDEKHKSLKNRESASKITLFVIKILNGIELFLIKRSKKIPFGSSVILTVEKK
jgi:SAM-dependent methyltransferase